MNITDLIPLALSFLPLLLRGTINFTKQELGISNNRKALLNQIRIGLSVEFAKNIQFEDDIVQIDDDFRSKFREYVNDFLYVNSSNLEDFNKANGKSKRAIKLIRVLKYSLVISTIASFIFYVLLQIDAIKIAELFWYIVFLGFVIFISIIWFWKERSVDIFNNLCLNYEVERNE